MGGCVCARLLYHSRNWFKVEQMAPFSGTLWTAAAITWLYLAVLAVKTAMVGVRGAGAPRTLTTSGGFPRPTASYPFSLPYLHPMKMAWAVNERLFFKGGASPVHCGRPPTSLRSFGGTSAGWRPSCAGRLRSPGMMMAPAKLTDIVFKRSCYH
jgi:hypothetical protein